MTLTDAGMPRERSTDDPGGSTLRRLTRRWKRHLWFWRGAIGVLVVLMAWAFVWEPGRLVECDYSLALPRWPSQCDGLRLDVVADTHTGSPHNGVDNLDRVVRRLIASDGQAVVMAGDYVILRVLLGTYVPADVIAAHLRPLVARKPVYAVLGNHDWWKNGDDIRSRFEEVGIHVLENRAEVVTLGDCRLWIVGIGDKWEGHPDPRRAFAAIDDDAPVIALTHNPDLFPDVPRRASLTIAGHTHGGQVRLPLIGSPVVPLQQDSPYVIGEIVADGRHLFVSPGIGTSILPVRLGVPPEISRLTLRQERAARR